MILSLFIPDRRLHNICFYTIFFYYKAPIKHLLSKILLCIRLLTYFYTIFKQHTFKQYIVVFILLYIYYILYIYLYYYIYIIYCLYYYI